MDENRPADGARPRRPWRWLAALIALLLVAELGLRLLPETAFLSPHDNAYWQAALREKLASTPPDRLLPPDLAFDATLGWRMKPGYSADGVHHNSRGYRGAREFSAASDRPRILLLGDSFTYGLGVADDETLGAQLATLTGSEVINTAVAAHSVDQSLLLWEHEGGAYRPRTVVLGYAVDKFFTNPLALRNLPKPWFSIGDNTLQLHGTPLPAPEQLADSDRLRRPFSFRLVDAGRWLLGRLRTKAGLSPDFTRQAALSEALLGRLDQSVRDNGGRLIVAFIGACFDGDADNRRAEEAIMASCKRLDLDCIDLAAAMRRGDYAGYYGGNCHWSPAGHRFAAERIAAIVNGAH